MARAEAQGRQDEASTRLRLAACRASTSEAEKHWPLKFQSRGHMLSKSRKDSARAALGPQLSAPESIANISVSLMIGTPSSRARSALLPESSPATTKFVFLETEPVTVAPARRRRSSACGRVSVSSLPVKTKVLPTSGEGPVEFDASSAIFSPAAR